MSENSISVDGKGTARKRKVRTIVLSIVLALLIAIIAACAYFIYSCEERANPEPSPTATFEVVQPDDGFPAVDWNYWLSVNPDVIGWVTVPGTNIDQPIVQAPKDNPTYYLKHDIYKQYNPMGVPYLDADCPNGLDSYNALIFGHHWKGGRVFSNFEKFSDYNYATEHQKILLQTPDSKRILNVQCVEVTRGSAKTKVCDFESYASFQLWYKDRFDASRVQLAITPGDGIGSYPKQIVSFCTCSYAHKNDRTLVYAADAAL